MKQEFFQLFSKLLIFVMATLLISEFVPALEIVKIICEIETNGVCLNLHVYVKMGTIIMKCLYICIFIHS